SCLNIHVTYVPYFKAAGEVKTKPTQHSVQALRAIGINPDFIIARCEVALSQEVREKISLFCNVKKEAVFDAIDVEKSIYEVPLHYFEQNVHGKIAAALQLPQKKTDLTVWKALIESIKHPKVTLRIGIVGKYVAHQDAYKSIFEALSHAGAHLCCAVEIVKIEPDKFAHEKSFPKEYQGCDGYIIPGGFGDRGWEGKIMAAKYCRENKVPYYGICLGMQVLVVEFARSVMKLQQANSTEMNAETPDPVIALLEEQQIVTERGGTMRLGAYPCAITSGTKAHEAYNSSMVNERHRHRYELNNSYREKLEKAGLIISGTFEEDNLAEIAEIKDHPWMVGVQFHPEFRSKPTEPHPLFRAFLEAAITHAKGQSQPHDLKQLCTTGART
ncbi:MAG TPA: CTP synthase, partial [Chlamydiales bacterium]|nr:CTP synthase [Chlamydiales bacterium]